ncbi:MAG: glycosyltransferase [Lachnospiraceae bacterium]|nr:glycosyltransferase [Lachnospiraceae bacterium]
MQQLDAEQKKLNKENLMELSKITLSPVKEAGNVELMYYRADSSVLRKRDGEGDFLLMNSGRSVSLDTYFNCFSYAKYLRYTRVRDVIFELELKGRFCIYVMKKSMYQQKRANSRRPMHFVEREEEVYSGEVYQEKKGKWRYCHDFSREKVSMIPAGDMDESSYGKNVESRKTTRSAFYYLKIISLEDGSCFYGGRYLTRTEPDQTVRAALDICTFKREEYVLRNVSDICKALLDNPKSSIRDSLEIFVVDNGQTLEGKLPEHKYVHWFPNRNYGGSGGFTRGILEAWDRRDRLTHVIMCDDDLYLDPLILEKMINFLKTVKPEYKDLHIHGGMFALNEPTFQTEASALWCHRGLPRKPLEMRETFNLLMNEAEEPFDYTGWWLTCMPLDVVKENGLPFPLFIKCDDTEYGLRNEKNVLILNGVGVWHEAFDKKYSAHLEYFFSRNDLVIEAYHGILGKKRQVLFRFSGWVLKHLFMQRYEAVYFKLRGMEDYLKGVDFFKSQQEDVLLKDLLAHNMKQYTQEELEKMGYPFDQNKYEQSCRWMTNRKERMINYLTLYGNLVPVCFYRKELNVVDMQASDPCHYSFRKHVLMWNSGDQKGAVTTASNRLFWKYFIQMCRLDMKYLLCGDRVAEEYRTRGKELTAIDFWKEHLGLKNSVKQVRLPARWSREAE